MVEIALLLISSILSLDELQAQRHSTQGAEKASLGEKNNNNNNNSFFVSAQNHSAQTQGPINLLVGTG